MWPLLNIAKNNSATAPSYEYGAEIITLTFSFLKRFSSI